MQRACDLWARDSPRLGEWDSEKMEHPENLAPNLEEKRGQLVARLANCEVLPRREVDLGCAHARGSAGPLACACPRETETLRQPRSHRSSKKSGTCKSGVRVGGRKGQAFWCSLSGAAGNHCDGRLCWGESSRQQGKRGKGICIELHPLSLSFVLVATSASGDALMREPPRRPSHTVAVLTLEKHKAQSHNSPAVFNWHFFF